MDIQVGDRVTFESVKSKEIITLIASSIAFINDLLDENYAKILKIERPKYEVVEEKIELLTDEEKEFLKSYMKVFKFKITELEKEPGKLVIWDLGSNYNVEIDEGTFKNLEKCKSYTLKELGLESD